MLHTTDVWDCQHGKIIYSIKPLEHTDKQTGLNVYV